ncbi:hypothetical protein CGCF413_v002033 [Colletotrichum fructicola]|nr:hypothetical protein CGCF413_v002033 [Colletotrichum fructicola]
MLGLLSSCQFGFRLISTLSACAPGGSGKVVAAPQAADRSCGLLGAPDGNVGMSMFRESVSVSRTTRSRTLGWPHSLRKA